MEIIVLGSGGVNPPPRPGCQCRVCREARHKGLPFYRTGPGLFFPAASLLVHTSPDIRQQLNREDIDLVQNLILTDFAPEHCQGLAILENLNYDTMLGRPIWNAVDVHFTANQLDSHESERCLRLLRRYQVELSLATLHEMSHCSAFDIGPLRILPVEIGAAEGWYFVIREGAAKIVYTPTPFKRFDPVAEAVEPDLFLVRTQYWQDSSVLNREIPNPGYIKGADSFEVMLETSVTLRAKKILVTHVEEDWGMSFRDLRLLPKLKYRDFNLHFAYDGMRISL